MPKKIILDRQSLTAFISHINDFVLNLVTPSVYDQSVTPEEEMQKHFSKYMSNWYDVLREVSIPACDKSGGTWEIDESIRTVTANGDSVYFAGELKLHAQNMADRPFTDQAKDDIDRMMCVANRYWDVTMGFTLFVTCDKNERDEVADYAKSLGLIPYMRNTHEQGYYAVIVAIIPIVGEDHTAPLYAIAYGRRLASVLQSGTEKDYYFPARVKIPR